MPKATSITRSPSFIRPPTTASCRQMGTEAAAVVKKKGELQVAVSLDRTESRHEVQRSFESYDPLRDPSMRPSPHIAVVAWFGVSFMNSNTIASCICAIRSHSGFARQ